MCEKLVGKNGHCRDRGEIKPNVKALIHIAIIINISILCGVAHDNRGIRSYVYIRTTMENN